MHIHPIFVWAKTPMLEMNEIWKSYFGDSEPVAHLLRDRFASRWVRFHSLPGSKRYPESENEMATVLERHNKVIGSVASEDEDIALLSTEFSCSAIPTQNELAEYHIAAEAEMWRTVAMHQGSDHWNESTYWHVFQTVFRWSRGTVDDVLRLVAEDRISNVMLLSARGWLYHPYDGGADVIAPTQRERRFLANEFSNWLSNHPSGL